MVEHRTVHNSEQLPPILQLASVTKQFPNGTVALRGVDLTVRPGTVHGLVGANGAGKSTIIKIVSGALRRTSGDVRWRGTSVDWVSPKASSEAGVATVHQHAPLVPSLSVFENTFLGRHAGWQRDKSALRVEFGHLTQRIGYQTDPDKLVADLSIGERQMVAIMHSLAQGSQLLILDEPTAALSGTERELIFATIRRLTAEDRVTVLYVSHYLDEILALTQHITVVRDGRVVADDATSKLSKKALVAAIVGQHLRSMETKGRDDTQKSDGGPIALEVDGLESPGIVEKLSFRLSEGEILGIAGLLGSGRSELLHALFGADPRAIGRVAVGGRTVKRSPVDAVRAGLALVPEDRVEQGLVAGWEIWRNISLPKLASMSFRRMFPSESRERQYAMDALGKLRIKARSVDTLVNELSGGNAQKVVLAKWILGGARVLLLDDPTVGVDVGAKADILELIQRFATQGGAVVIVSSEFEELLACAHRILIMRKGRIVSERLAEDTSDRELLALASGL